MKKLVVFLVIFALVFCFSGCSMLEDILGEMVEDALGGMGDKLDAAPEGFFQGSANSIVSGDISGDFQEEFFEIVEEYGDAMEIAPEEGSANSVIGIIGSLVSP